ncbi:hypothetical protein ACFQ15_10525 [Sphingomonas hankookensis]|uniref:hypothetical protein n=1 Tax=Sphingomonas hankookensis TaxID=563996 RepID=UPI001F57D6D4|nr:hypothetical protein [Sphingomonas hankookensis]
MTPVMIAMLLAAGVPAQVKVPDTGDRDIRALAAKFQHAIKHRDKAAFLSLFLRPEATNWQEVMSDAAVAKDRSSKGVKAAFDAGNNPIAFIDSIVSRKGNAEEDFRNVRINRDGDSAAMSFDYSFRIDGVEVNAGMEHWLLVRGNAGWRIVSVAWSVR